MNGEYVLNVYTLAGERGTGSHFLAVPRIDVSKHFIIRLGKTKRAAEASFRHSPMPEVEQQPSIHALCVSSNCLGSQCVRDASPRACDERGVRSTL